MDITSPKNFFLSVLSRNVWREGSCEKIALFIVSPVKTGVQSIRNPLQNTGFRLEFTPYLIRGRNDVKQNQPNSFTASQMKGRETVTKGNGEEDL